MDEKLPTKADLAKENKRLREALMLCDPNGDRLRAFGTEQPEDALVRQLCEAYGYGAVIDSATRLWRAKDPRGAFTKGPCVATVQRALGINRQ